MRIAGQTKLYAKLGRDSRTPWSVGLPQGPCMSQVRCRGNHRTGATKDEQRRKYARFFQERTQLGGQTCVCTWSLSALWGPGSLEADKRGIVNRDMKAHTAGLDGPSIEGFSTPQTSLRHERTPFAKHLLKA